MMDTTKKILVVDDEPDLVQLIGFQFKAKGFEVKTAGDGIEALQVIEGFKPDLIILDMNMPRMGGIEFYSKVCGSNAKPLYPILVLTARANVEGLFKEFEIDGFMIKPFDIDHLVHEAEVIIKKRSQEVREQKKFFSSTVRKICIVENDPTIFGQLTGMLMDANYSVIPAKSGAAAIERMMKEVPDVALVQLGLADISGDTVISRLSQMCKTMEVKFILYTSLEAQHDREVMKKLGTKAGIVTFIEYRDLADVLEAIKNV